MSSVGLTSTRNMSNQIEYKPETEKMIKKTIPYCTKSALLKNIEKVKFLLGFQSIIRFKRFITDRVLLSGALSCKITLHTIESSRAERRSFSLCNPL